MNLNMNETYAVPSRLNEARILQSAYVIADYDALQGGDSNAFYIATWIYVTL
jgi:hypothetical protein